MTGELFGGQPATPAAPAPSLLPVRIEQLARFHRECFPPKVSHHAKRIVRRGPHLSLADTEELAESLGIWGNVLAPMKQQAPQAFEGPLVVSIALTWPWRKGDSGKKRRTGRIPCTVKPDVDNIAKTIIDTLARLLIIRGDQEICRLTVTKWIGDHPGVEIQIGRLTSW